MHERNPGEPSAHHLDRDTYPEPLDGLDVGVGVKMRRRGERRK